MGLALERAKLAMSKGEVPVGAVVIKSGKVISQASNSVKELSDATAHAEVLAIKQACFILQSSFLCDCDIYTTLEPCTMCSGAISLARIRRLYFGAYDLKTGSVYHGARVFATSSCHYKPEIYGGIMEKDCSQILTEFFQKIRSSIC